MKRIWMPALGTLVLAGALVASRPATTAPAKAAGDTAISVGYVDVQKVLQDAPAAVKARKDAEDLKEKLQGQLALQQDLIFLADADQAELKSLQDKQPKTDKDKSRIADLQKKSQAAEEEWRSLQQNTQPTDAQKARLSELSNMRSRNTAALQAAQQKAQEDLDKRAGELMDGLQERILKVVEQVATDEKLAMVVDKQARLYGGRDITDLVVGKLKN
jgi:Skp family chaperone for outer membrane proteins